MPSAIPAAVSTAGSEGRGRAGRQAGGGRVFEVCAWRLSSALSVVGNNYPSQDGGIRVSGQWCPVITN